MVVVCILVSALTTLCGTLFIQKLIDNYIVPLTQMAVPDYSPLAQALLKLVAIFAVGVLCSYGYNRIMVNVGQGTMKSSVQRCLLIWNHFQSDTLIHMHMEISCRYTQMILIH